MKLCSLAEKNVISVSGDPATSIFRVEEQAAQESEGTDTGKGGNGTGLRASQMMERTKK